MQMINWEENRISRGQTATQQQRKASNPNTSVWVEASAGTGKTKVLSDRVLRLLLKGVHPSKILCLTYTKAAAVQMSDRIAERLSQWSVISDELLDKELSVLLGKLPDNQNDYFELIATARRLFAVLLDTPGGMKIQTLHSFCQEVLKRFPLEAKISPYFEVMDDRAKREILDVLKHNLLSLEMGDNKVIIAQAVGYLTSHVSEFSFPDLMSSITDNAGKIIQLFQKYPSVENLFEELSKRLGVTGNEDEDTLKLKWLSSLDKMQLRNMVNAWLQGSTTDIKKANALVSILERDFCADDYDCFCSVFLNKDGSFCARYATNKVLKIYPDIHEESLKIAESLSELRNILSSLKVFNSTKAVIILAEELINNYQQYKFAHAKMDYDDLIVLTRRLLEDKSVSDWVLFKLDGGIDNVLIDEAQDTSPNQWAIIRSLTQEFFNSEDNKRTIFVVGDRKQSIYSFQGADPKEFDNMRKYFKSKVKHFDEVNLDISFRSTNAIMDCVNTVFADDVAKQGVLIDNERMMHVPFRCGDAGKVEIWPLLEAREDDSNEVWLPPVERVVTDSTSSRLAKMIAERIKMMVGNEYLPSKGRKLMYKDFLILVQRRNVFVDELVRECKKVGVAIAGVDKIKLLEQVSVQDLVALGKFLLLPTDDLTLAEVLKSPLFNLTDDDLMDLCIGRNNAYVWTRLADNSKYAEIYKILQTLLNMADYVRPFELYSYVLNVLGGRKKFEERMGLEVDDGLDEFVNLTLNFEREHIPTLQSFIDWIGKDEVEIKREQEQSDLDVVRIMTVHGSKGLQAPVVILPDTVRQANTKKGMGMLWDDVFYYPLSASDYDKNCINIKEKEKQDDQEEYRRLLYVALTRAEDRLCLCGYCLKNKPKDNCWYELCSRTMKQIAQEENTGLVYETEQSRPVKTNELKVIEQDEIVYPLWLKEKAEPELPLAKPYTPSKPDEIDDEDALFSPLIGENNNRYRRGIVIHRLLQFLPEIVSDDKMSIIREFLRQNADDFSDKQKDKIAEEVYYLVTHPDFAPLFGLSSKAEVPIMGEVDGKIISAQIDRLVVLDDEVWIVDFKTNRPAAKTVDEVQKVYVKQLSVYKTLLERIYPQKMVKTFLLWTDTAQIMQIVS